jgi:putative flippase GtrA
MSPTEAPADSLSSPRSGQRSLATEALHFLQFGLSGLPAFLVALALNKFLVAVAGWPKPVAYLPVVWMQMNVGFLMCHYVVFRSNEHRPLLTAYWQYILSMWAIRGIDWLLYTLLVEVIHIPYLVAQISTSAVLLLVKFFSAKAIFRSKAT